MRNPAAAHANTLGTPKVGAPSSSASGNRSKNATATTAPALKPSTHCIREARRSASRPPVQVVQNAAPDSAKSSIADLGVGADVDYSWVLFNLAGGHGIGRGRHFGSLALDAHLSGNPIGVGAVLEGGHGLGPQVNAGVVGREQGLSLQCRRDDIGDNLAHALHLLEQPDVDPTQLVGMRAVKSIAHVVVGVRRVELVVAAVVFIGDGHEL